MCPVSVVITGSIGFFLLCPLSSTSSSIMALSSTSHFLRFFRTALTALLSFSSDRHLYKSGMKRELFDLITCCGSTVLTVIILCYHQNCCGAWQQGEIYPKQQCFASQTRASGHHRPPGATYGSRNREEKLELKEATAQVWLYSWLLHMLNSAIMHGNTSTAVPFTGLPSLWESTWSSKWSEVCNNTHRMLLSRGFFGVQQFRRQSSFSYSKSANKKCNAFISAKLL